MKPNNLFSLGILLVLVFFVTGCANDGANGSTDGKNNEASNKLPPPAVQKYAVKSSGSTGQGDVLVEAAPKGMVDGKFVVEVSMNTHTVDLGTVDLAGNVVLVAGGKEFLPVDVPALSGHHSSGEIVFGIAQEPESFSIIITGVPSVEKREFNWS